MNPNITDELNIKNTANVELHRLILGLFLLRLQQYRIIFKKSNPETIETPTKTPTSNPLTSFLLSCVL